MSNKIKENHKSENHKSENHTSENHTSENHTSELRTLDEIIGKKNINECSIFVKTDVCTPSHILKTMVNGELEEPFEILEKLKKETKCNSEICVIKSKLSKQVASDIIRRYFKLSGPGDASLLNNINIDNTLIQWSMYNKDFYPWNFNMRNYVDYHFKDGRTVDGPDTLATIQFIDKYKSNYKCGACVINSDVYQGPGKHWMALFVDCRKEEDSVEFFNSSGNAPAGEWVNWMVKTKNQLEDYYYENNIQKMVKIINVSTIKHQRSKSECGVYSLFYIYCRLNNIPYKFFQEKIIQDKFMFEFRNLLFSDDRIKIKKFDWGEFQKIISTGGFTNVRWENS